MEPGRAVAALRIAAVNSYFAILLLVAVYVQHWAALVLWFALLLGLLVGAISGRPEGFRLGFLSFLGWLVLGTAVGLMAGQAMWSAFLVAAIVCANYLVYDWDRPSPPPADPKSPAFADPYFSAAVAGLILSGSLILLSVFGAIPQDWLLPACGVSGFAIAVIAISMARWQIRT